MHTEQTTLYDASHWYSSEPHIPAEIRTVSFFENNPVLIAYEASHDDPNRFLHVDELVQLVRDYPHISPEIPRHTYSIADIVSYYREKVEQFQSDTSVEHNKELMPSYAQVCTLLEDMGVDPALYAQSETIVLTLPPEILHDPRLMTSIVNILTSCRLIECSSQDIFLQR